MKKFKTIIAILFLSFTIFSFQNKSVTKELKNQNRNVSNSEISKKVFPEVVRGTTFYVKYKKNVSELQRIQIRTQFQQAGLNISSVNACNSLAETWMTQSLTYDEFLGIFHSIYDPTIDPYTGIGTTSGGTGPGTELDFAIYYDADCTTN